MNMCAGACVCVCVCAHVRTHVYALRIVSMDKIVCFTNSLIIIIINSTEYIQFHNQSSFNDT